MELLRIFWISLAVLNVQVLVQGSHMLNTNPDPATVVVGGNVTFDCRVENFLGNGNVATVYFYHYVGTGNGSQIALMSSIQPPFRSVQRYVMPNAIDNSKTDGSMVFQLKIIGAQNEDNAVTACVIYRQSVMEANLTKSLLVKSKPDMAKVMLEGKYMTNGSHYTLNATDYIHYECNVTGGYPVPEVSVTIGDRVVTASLQKISGVSDEPTPSPLTLRFRRSFTRVAGRLSISSLDHNKTVVCKGNTPGMLDTVVSSVMLHFVKEPVKPQFMNCTEEVVVRYLQQNIVLNCTYASSEVPLDIHISYPIGKSNPSMYKGDAWLYKTQNGSQFYNLTEIIQHGARQDWEKHSNDKRVTVYGDYRLESQWGDEVTYIKFYIVKANMQMFRPYTFTVVRGPSEEDTRTINLKMDPSSYHDALTARSTTIEASVYFLSLVMTLVCRLYW